MFPVEGTATRPRAPNTARQQTTAVRICANCTSTPSAINDTMSAPPNQPSPTCPALPAPAIPAAPPPPPGSPPRANRHEPPRRCQLEHEPSRLDRQHGGEPSRLRSEEGAETS